MLLFLAEFMEEYRGRKERSKRWKLGAGKESKSARSEPKNSIGNPDVSVLKNYSPTERAQSQPDWVKAKFPGYIASHDRHEATSVRELTHNGQVGRPGRNDTGDRPTCQI